MKLLLHGKLEKLVYMPQNKNTKKVFNMYYVSVELYLNNNLSLKNIHI